MVLDCEKESEELYH